MIEKDAIMKEFIDGTKRIKIDYKNIQEYDKPFVMTLEVDGKRKLDVWKVRNGQEAYNIRKRYKRISRHTSYKDFYKTIKDLVDEKGKDNLQFKPRIRGKNQKEKIKQYNFDDINRDLMAERNKSSIQITDQRIVETLKFIAELNNKTPEEIATGILTAHLKTIIEEGSQW